MKKILFLLFVFVSFASFGQVPDTSRAKKEYGNMIWVKYDTTAATCDTLGIFPGVGNGVWATDPIHLFSENDTVLNVEGVSVFKDAYVNLYNGNWIVKDYTNNEQLTWGAHVQRGWNLSNEALYYDLSPGGLEIGASDTDFCKIYGDSIILGARVGILGTSAKLTANAFYVNQAQGLNIYDGTFPNLIMSIGTDSAISMTGGLHVSGEVYSDSMQIGGNTEIDGDLIVNGLYYQSGSTNLVNDASIILTNGISGWGEVYTFDSGAIDEWAEFIISSDGAVLLKSTSTDVVNTDTADKLCIFDNGTGVTIRNRLGGTRTIKYIIHH